MFAHFPLFYMHTYISVHIYICSYVSKYLNVKYNTNVHPWRALSNRTLNIVLIITTTTNSNINQHTTVTATVTIPRIKTTK